MAIASSKHVILTFLIVTLDPYGSIPSVLRGKVGKDGAVLPTKRSTSPEYLPSMALKIDGTSFITESSFFPS